MPFGGMNYRTFYKTIFLILLTVAWTSASSALANPNVERLTELALGYIVHRPFWRKGYAAEAAAACRDHAFGALGASRLITLVRPENLASLGVARKIGMTIERRTIENAIVIPQNALVHDDLGTGVFVVEDNGGDLIARRKNVMVGASFGGRTVVQSGLADGDQVVVVGQSNLTDGNFVEVAGA